VRWFNPHCKFWCMLSGGTEEISSRSVGILPTETKSRFEKWILDMRSDKIPYLSIRNLYMYSSVNIILPYSIYSTVQSDRSQGEQAHTKRKGLTLLWIPEWVPFTRSCWARDTINGPCRTCL